MALCYVSSGNIHVWIPTAWRMAQSITMPTNRMRSPQTLAYCSTYGLQVPKEVSAHEVLAGTAFY